MKRVVVGDVFACQLPEGVAFVQLAHKEREHPQYKGTEYIRLLPGVHEAVNVAQLVHQPEKLVVEFPIGRLYRKQGCAYVGHFPLPEGWTLPKYRGGFGIRQRERQEGRRVGRWAISETMEPADGKVHVPTSFLGIDDIDVVPEEYRTTLIDGSPDPYLLHWWMASGGDLHQPERLLASEAELDAFIQTMGNRLDHCYK